MLTHSLKSGPFLSGTGLVVISCMHPQYGSQLVIGEVWLADTALLIV